MDLGNKGSLQDWWLQGVSCMIVLFFSTSTIMGIKCFRCIHMNLQIKRKHSFAQLLLGVCVFFLGGGAGAPFTN